MQERHLAEIDWLFGLPVVRMPLFETEIAGIPMVARAASALFEPQPAMRVSMPTGGKRS